MTAPVLVDTSILVYARDAGEPAKQPRASEILRLLWETRAGRVSTQVLQEYYVTVTRKLRPGLPVADARADVTALEAWRPHAPGTATFRRAWEVEDRYGFSWWDSLVIASALDTGSGILISEDLQHGQTISGLRILNPFHPDFQIADLPAKPPRLPRR
jgi:predicted nucleic acid-binding protein